MQHVPTAVGRALKRARSSPRKLAFNAPTLHVTPGTLSVSSSAFSPGAAIPARYTADGEGVSPPLAWRGVPSDARGLLLLIEDADSPSFDPLVHAIVLDLPAHDDELAEGALRSTDQRKSNHAFGRNSFLRTAYLPPDPPPGHGVHHYAFEVFALDREFTFKRPPGRRALLDFMEGHVLAKGCLFGTYQRF